MSQTLIVNNNTYNCPTDGDSPGWGEQVSGWMKDVTNVLTTLTAGFISDSINILQDESSSWLEINNLFFLNGVYRGAEITYYVDRLYNTTQEVVEFGKILVVYNTREAKWYMSQGPKVGDAKIQFRIQPSGQMEYWVHTLGGTIDGGKMQFESKPLAI